jgi:hypothetical protein
VVGRRKRLTLAKLLAHQEIDVPIEMIESRHHLIAKTGHLCAQTIAQILDAEVDKTKDSDHGGAKDADQRPYLRFIQRGHTKSLLVAAEGAPDHDIGLATRARAGTQWLHDPGSSGGKNAAPGLS